VGQSYYDCNPLYTGAACTEAAAIEACTAYAISLGGSAADCSDGWSCSCNHNTCNPPYTVCYSINGTTPAGNYCFGYSGSTPNVECEVTTTTCGFTQEATWN
jgi:hypothetical protein